MRRDTSCGLVARQSKTNLVITEVKAPKNENFNNIDRHIKRREYRRVGGIMKRTKTYYKENR